MLIVIIKLCSRYWTVFNGVFHLKKFLFKTIPFLLCFSLLLSSFLVPVRADSVEPAMKVHDLMQGIYFDTFLNNVQIEDSTLNPFIAADGSTYSFSFAINTNMTFKTFVFTVDLTDVNPSSVRFIVDTTGAAGRIVGVNGSRVTFRVDNHAPGSNIRININYPTSSFRVVSLLSCFGYYDVSKEIDSVDAEYRSYFMSADGTYYLTTVKDNSALPVSYSESGSDPYNILTHSEGFVFIRPDQRDLDFAESISFLVTVLGDESDISAALVDDNATILSPLTSLSVNAVSRSVRPQGDFMWYLTTFLVTVDLSGFDLKDKSIQLFFTSDVAESGSADSGEVSSYMCVEGCYISADVQATESWWGRVLWWFASIRQTIRIEVREVVSAIQAVFSGDEDLKQAGNVMSEQADQMNQAQDSMNSVERPTIDSDELLGGFLNFDTGGLRILSALTSNAWVPQLMIVVFTLALCGYVFFGKKGR